MCSSPSAEKERCRAVITGYFASLTAGSMRAVLAHYAPDAEVSLAGNLALCGTYRGTDRILQWAREIFSRLDPTTLEFPLRYRIFAVDPPIVCAVMTARAVSVDGLVYDPTYSMIFEVGGDRIVRHWEFADTALLEQLTGNALTRPQEGAGAPFAF